MPTVKFHLQTPYETKKNGEKKPAEKETRLYAFLIVDRLHVAKLKTKHVVKPTDWDFDSQGKKDRLTGAAEFNAGLATLKTELLGQYDKLREGYPDATFPELTTLLKQYVKDKELPKFSAQGFFEVMDEFIKSLEGEVSPGTVKKFNTLKRSLTDFTAANKRFKPLTFTMIDHSFYDAYIKHLRTQTPRGRQLRRPEGLQTGLLNDSIGKYISDLKNFCKWAEERGYNQNQTYTRFKPISTGNRKRKAERRDIVTLTLDELTAFYQHDFSARPALERVRDVFCFGCFTGQRWSDIERFNKDDLRGDVWSFIAYKTKKRQVIDMCGFSAPALDILQKYNFTLPVISLQKFNDTLKTAGEAAGINTPVSIKRYSGVKEIETVQPKYYFMSSHMARRTCVSILLNNFGMAPSLVMEITAHTDLKTLQKYLNTDRSARREAMSRTKAVTEIMKVTHKAAI